MPAIAPVDANTRRGRTAHRTQGRRTGDSSYSVLPVAQDPVTWTKDAKRAFRAVTAWDLGQVTSCHD